MSGENMKENYGPIATKAFEDCMQVMMNILPAYGNNTSEFVMATTYVAGGILASALVFAPDHAARIILKAHLMQAMDSVLEQQIQEMKKQDQMKRGN